MSDGRDDLPSRKTVWVSVSSWYEPVPTQGISKLIAQYTDG